MPLSSDELHVSSLDETPLTSYRNVSVTAVLALVLGLASALALIHPFLWIVPAIAVVVAMLALRAIDAEDAHLTGRSLAIGGLMLALMFGLWGPTRIVARQWHLYRQARAFADDWLDLLRGGQRYAAHQLTLRAAERQPAEVALERYYSNSADAQIGLERFFGDKPIKSLAELKDGATYEYAGGDGVAPKEFITEHIALRYTARITEAGRARAVPIRIVLDRDEGEAGVYYWRVRGISDPNRVDN